MNTKKNNIKNHTKQKRKLVKVKKTKKRQTGGGVSSLYIPNDTENPDILLKLISENQQVNPDSGITQIDDIYSILQEYRYSTKYTFTDDVDKKIYLTGSLIKETQHPTKIYLVGLFKKINTNTFSVDLFPIYKSIDDPFFFKNKTAGLLVPNTKKIIKAKNENLLEKYELFHIQECVDEYLNIPLSYGLYYSIDDRYIDKIYHILSYYIRILKHILNKEDNKHFKKYQSIFYFNLFNYIYSSYIESIAHRGIVYDKDNKKEKLKDKHNNIFTLLGFQYKLGEGYVRIIFGDQQINEDQKVKFFTVKNDKTGEILCEPIDKLGGEYTKIIRSSLTGSLNVTYTELPIGLTGADYGSSVGREG